MTYRAFANAKHSRIAALVLVAISVARCAGSEPAAPTLPATPKPGKVHGSLVSSIGGGIAAAFVRLTHGSSEMTSRTGADGTFSFDELPAGSGTVAFDSLPPQCDRPPGLTYSVVAGGTAVVNATASCVVPTGTISGRLLSQASDTLAGASVSIIPAGASSLPPKQTESDGSFSFADVQAGSGVVRVRGLPAPCPTPADVPYTLGFRDTLHMPLTVTCAQVGHLDGSVKNSYGQVLPNRPLTIVPAEGSAITGEKTDYQGVFNRPHVPIGDGVITVSGDSLPSICTPAPVAYSALRFNERRTVNVVVPCFRGRVTGKVFSSLGGARSTTVELHQSARSLVASASPTAGFLFDSLPAGDGRLHVSAGWVNGNWCGAADTSFTLTSDSMPLVRDMVVPCSGTVTVYAWRSNDSTLLRGGRVNVKANRADAIGGFGDLLGSPVTFAGPDSDSALVRLLDLHESCVPKDTIITGLFTRATTRVDLTAQCGGELEVRVLAAGGYTSSADIVVKPSGGTQLSATSSTGGLFRFTTISSDSGVVEVTRTGSGCIPSQPTPFSGLTKASKLTIEISVECP